MALLLMSPFLSGANLGQEFVIKSKVLEYKINSLLPSQGGAGAGVDLSASTTVIPIVDLTESAEGSTLRQDLQTSLGFTTATAFDVNNTTTTIINTTGYYRITGGMSMRHDTSTVQTLFINLTDGTTTKTVFGIASVNGGNSNVLDFDKVIFLKAGESCIIVASASARFVGSSRQIADINGSLINP